MLMSVFGATAYSRTDQALEFWCVTTIFPASCCSPRDINVVTKSDPPTTETRKEVTQYMCPNNQVTTDYISRLLKIQNKHTMQKPIKK
jgi:hypothetical protein